MSDCGLDRPRGVSDRNWTMFCDYMNGYTHEELARNYGVQLRTAKRIVRDTGLWVLQVERDKQIDRLRSSPPIRRIA